MKATTAFANKKNQSEKIGISLHWLFINMNMCKNNFNYQIRYVKFNFKFIHKSFPF